MEESAKVNQKKTNYVVLSREDGRGKELPTVIMRFERVQSFKYLMFALSETNNIEEIKNRPVVWERNLGANQAEKTISELLEEENSEENHQFRLHQWSTIIILSRFIADSKIFVTVLSADDQTLTCTCVPKILNNTINAIKIK